MVTLCNNRPEGFGPHSSLHPSIPTTCFLDTILTPSVTWLYLFVLPFLLPLYAKSLRSHNTKRLSATDRFVDDDGLPILRSEWDDDPAPRRGVFIRILSVLYYLLAIAMLGMMALEIARLNLADLGIGLLPFTFGGILAALVLRSSWQARIVRLVNATYWVLLAAAMSVKLVAELREEDGKENRVKGDGVVGRYPTSDEALDVAVMVGVEAALGVLEFIEWQRLAWY
ncbi:hypothetical protein EV356DRAFT_504330 [Viridothelium virens]|uniref:Uncharacterized protein n=1 Tax=Viridothelium virens TaxID=1048519 RepID=A0A6A6HN66_VIRVR|nr:hypothetical protein EV356DRAFT_504330 [Viridothelium virens]